MIDAGASFFHAGLRMRQIEARRAPGRSRMTICATGPKGPGMEIRIGMAGHALGRCSYKGVVGMALFTLHIGMCAIQRESGTVMVKGDAIPTYRHMTGRTIFAEVASMCIILLMTGVTIRRCSLKDTVLMARFASYFRMGTFQLESRKIVIEFCRLPTVRGMAGSAVGAEARFMWVVSAVTGIAVLWRCREVNQAARINMALCTGHFQMFPRQLELKAIVIELFAKPIYSIVTIQTGCAISLNVRLGKAGVHLTVAGLT
jgi:hypothetical protein